MSVTISQKVHFRSLLRFSLPTIVMLIFMSLYSIVDGVFVSQFIGTNALSAINIVWPLLNLVCAIAIMFGTGGSAVVARKLGEGDENGARHAFTLIALTAAAAGVLIALLGGIFFEPLLRLFGATDVLAPYCRDYLGTLLPFLPMNLLQMLFQIFFVTASHPHLGLGLTIASGVLNAVLDYIFIVPLGMGIRGAALATAAGYLIPSLYGIFFFAHKRSTLHFVRPRWDGRLLGQTCANGSSEMIVNLSNAVTTLLYNLIMLRLAGEDGVAAITIILYVQFIFTGFYQGFSDGIAPVVSYNYGSRNTAQLRRIFRIALTFLLASALVLTLVSELSSDVLVGIFARAGTPAHALAAHGFPIYSVNFLFVGFNIFCSSFFTALSNGRISAAVSFLRTCVFLIGGLALLPTLCGTLGVWLAVPLAELLTLAFSIVFLVRGAKQYQYF